VWSPLLVTYDDGRQNITAELLVHVGDDGKPFASEVTVRNVKGRVDAQDLRLPIHTMVRAAIAASVVQGPVKEAGSVLAPGDRIEYWATDLLERRRRRSQRTDEYLTRVAEIYGKAFHEGRGVQRAVADELHIAVPTAANTIAEARRRGFLPPTKRRIPKA
jgi:hypothetical protein